MRPAPAPVPPPPVLRPAEQAFVALSQSLYDDFIIAPLRDGASAAAYAERIAARWGSYLDTLHALLIFTDRLRRESAALELLTSVPEAAIRAQVSAYLPTLAGESSVREFDFCVATYDRACRLAGRFETMGEPSDMEEDRRICGDFISAMALHVHARGALVALAAGERLRSSEVLDAIFFMLRTGALEAYQHARAAYDLRQPQQEELPLPAVGEAEARQARDLADEHIADAERLIVALPHANPLKGDSVAFTEQLRALSVERLEEDPVGRVTQAYMAKIEACLAYVLDLPS